MTIKSVLKKRTHTPFRRLFFKRRLSGGDYETNWQTIPSDKIKSWGTIQYNVDDVMPNFVKTGNVALSVYNDDGYFSDVSEEKSFFYTAITRYRTLVKYECGYTDSDGTEYPTDSSLFVGIITKDAKYKQDNIVQFSIQPLTQIFEEFPADQISGMGSSQTTEDFITKIRDHQQEATTTSYIFRKYISSGAWYFTTTTKYYNLATSTSLENKTVWKLLQDLAAAEQMVVYVDRFGDFYFKERTPTGSSSYHFSGIGDTDKTYGHNIMVNISVDENIRKVYNRVVIDFNTGTSDTRSIKNEDWDWGDSSSSFYYGVHEFKYSNKLINDTTTAEEIRDAIYDEYVRPKREIRLTTKFVPQLMTEDRVSVTYKTKRYEGGYLWGVHQWNQAYWGERLGYNILLDSTTARIINISHNLDNFTSNLILREL